MRRLWILHLVPGFAGGRWLAGLVTFTVMAALLFGPVDFSNARGEFTGYIPLFFCVIVAYIVPVFHFITAHTEQAFDDLNDLLLLPAEERSRLRADIAQKSWLWVALILLLAVGLWLLQSWLLAGTDVMVAAFTTDLQEALLALGPLIVWIVMTCVIAALIDNALLFRRLVKRVEVDIYDTRCLTPFGRMAVSSILAVVGAQASFSIMWLGDTTNPWTTIPGLIPPTLALAFLFFAPVWPLHKALREAKNAELDELQLRINARQRDNHRELAPLLALRREVLSTPEWPVDLSLLARLTLYLVIVPLTWIGAALIENIVDVFVS